MGMAGGGRERLMVWWLVLLRSRRLGRHRMVLCSAVLIGGREIAG